MLYEGSGRSLPQRILVQVVETLLLVLGAWLTLRGDGDTTRRVLLVCAMVVVYSRLTVTIFVFVRRAMGWEEAISINAAFALYYIGFALLGRDVSAAVGALGYAGVVLFLAGSVVNTASEALRHRWKLAPGHDGRLYTGGLFRFSRHVNYFGDLLWVLGLACICGSTWAFAIPALLFAFFAFYNVPMLDRHLEEHYGEAFREYAAKTARFIPFVY